MLSWWGGHTSAQAGWSKPVTVLSPGLQPTGSGYLRASEQPFCIHNTDTQGKWPLDMQPTGLPVFPASPHCTWTAFSRPLGAPALSKQPEAPRHAPPR